MKGKALRKHSLHEKTAASDLLKSFMSSNEWCHTTDESRVQFLTLTIIELLSSQFEIILEISY